MICKKCGKQTDANSRFCLHCGNELTNMQDKPKRKSVMAYVWCATTILLAIVIVLMFTGVFSVNAISSEPSISFKTPEDAINYFIECVKNEDIDGALRACAAEEIAQGFDYEAMIKRIACLMPTIEYLPSEYDMFLDYNRLSTKSRILRQLAWMTFSITLPEEYDAFLDMSPIMGQDIDLDKVVDDMNPEILKDIEIVEIDESGYLHTDQHQNNLKRDAEVYGADDATSRAVLYEVDGKYYVGGFALYEYDGRWLIARLNEVLINQPVMGTLIKVESKSEFQDMLKR